MDAAVVVMGVVLARAGICNVQSNHVSCFVYDRLAFMQLVLAGCHAYVQ